MESKFILGDCMDPEMGLPSYPDNFFDLAIVDPPYGIDYQSAWRSDNSRRHKKIANDKRPFTEWIEPLFHKMNQGGRVICFYRWDVAHEFISAFREAGFNVVHELIWDKVVNGMNDLKACPAPQHESAIYCTKGRFEFKSTRPKSIYRTPRVYADTMVHPNEKPEWLYRKLTEDFGTGLDTCVDLFAGSANSLRVWDSMGLDYVGYEIDPDYYAAAIKRMKAGIQKSMF